MYIRSLLQDKQMTFLLSGEIDHHEAKQAIQTVTEKIDIYMPRNCVLDFLEVPFMDSSGIAIVIAAIRRMRELDGKLSLHNVGPQPMKVLRAAGIEKIAEIKEGALQ